MIAETLLLTLGVGVLYFGAEWLVRGAARLAGGLGVSPIVVGLTVVSLGTSAPEMVVAIFAVVGDNGDLAVGNVLGSNLANIGLILGFTAVVRPLVVANRVVIREVPIMLAITVLLYPLALDLELARGDGIVLLVVLFLYLIFVGWTAQSEDPVILAEYEDVAKQVKYASMRAARYDFGLVVVGASGVVLGGQLIVDNAVFIARALGVSELVIGLSVVAIGTSLPELATSMVAAVRQEADIAVGNIIGSNIFNLAAVLGVASFLGTISVARHVLTVELPAVLLISALILPVSWSGSRIQRWEGFLLVGTYAGLCVWIFG